MEEKLVDLMKDNKQLQTIVDELSEVRVDYVNLNNFLIHLQ